MIAPHFNSILPVFDLIPFHRLLIPFRCLLIPFHRLLMANGHRFNRLSSIHLHLVEQESPRPIESAPVSHARHGSTSGPLLRCTNCSTCCTDENTKRQRDQRTKRDIALVGSFNYTRSCQRWKSPKQPYWTRDVHKLLLRHLCFDVLIMENITSSHV